MGSAVNRSLGGGSLAVLLVSTHYGLGFLLGTAEQAAEQGATGSLYGISIGLGTLVLLALVKLYWSQEEQVWTLLGQRYGRFVKVGVGLMSWMSLIGIEAVQIIAAAAILNLVGIPTLLTMVVLTSLFCGLSLLPVERASWVFRGLLVFNILALVYASSALHGLPNYWQLPLDFIPALPQLRPTQAIGLTLSTILLTLIDMKGQQFIVQAKDLRSAYWGCVLAALMLVGLAFLPSVVVVTAQQSNILPADLAGNAVIPYVLAWVGGGATQPWGIALMTALAVPALGLGSNVLRIQGKMILDLEIVSDVYWNRLGIAVINALLALAIALKGGGLINLILYFYTAYLSAVWVPFLAYLLAYFGVYTFSKTGVQLSLVVSALSSVMTLVVMLVKPETMILTSPELTLMAIGLGSGALTLLSAQGTEKLLSIFKPEEKTQA